MRFAAIAVALLAMLACQRQENVDVEKSTPPSTNSAPPVIATSTSGTVQADRDDPGARPTIASPMTQVQLLEFRIDMPDALPAGKRTFNIINSGEKDHAFAVEGNGIEEKTQTLKRGDTASL